MSENPLTRSQNLKQLLLARSDWFAEEIHKSVSQSEYAYLTPGQTRLLSLMGGRAQSMAELARRLAISRQAAHKRVMELCKRGILELRDDPERGNSKLVYYTEKGREVNRRGAQIIERIEQRIASRIGEPKLEALRKLLNEDWTSSL
jgi:DNA-binding MarR family transcriptional regulator